MDKINKISPGQNNDEGLLAALTGRNTDFDDGEEFGSDDIAAETMRLNKVPK